MASKFFEHFIDIADAMNSLGGTGLWDEEDGFYYDQLKVEGQMIPLRTRSLVGLLPLIAVEILETEKIDKLPGFKKRMEWFLNYRKDLAQLITYCEVCPCTGNRMLAIPTRERLQRALALHAGRKRISFAASACAPFRASIASSPTSSARATKNIVSITSRVKEPAIFSAATRTGADRSGSRSIS